MKVALVHDHLIQNGGAERVLEALQSLYVDAPIYTLLYDKKRMDPYFGHRSVHTSFLQQLPGALNGARWYLPLMPVATETYDLNAYDVVLSSSSAFSKGVITNDNSLHICYCHTPTRYLWTDTHSYIQEQRAPAIVKRALPFLLSKLRTWDRLAADRVDYFIANSETVKQRIKKFYRRDATVIHPPVTTDTFFLSNKPKDYFLIGGRLVAYKRYDLVIDAFNKLGLPLKIFGTGPTERSLKARAGSNIEFLGAISNDMRAHLFANAKAFLHPQEEDFGITAIESMASGRPVIAYARGGATESVIEGTTGVFFERQTVEEIASTVYHFNEAYFDPAAIRRHAEQFSLNVFHSKMQQFVKQTYEQHKQSVRGNA